MVHRAYPKVLLRVGEHPAYLGTGGFEGKAVLVLVYHVVFHIVIEEHSVLVRIQQQAVAAVGVNVADVGTCQ